jgi:hypothetical protein
MKENKIKEAKKEELAVKSEEKKIKIENENSFDANFHLPEIKVMQSLDKIQPPEDIKKSQMDIKLPLNDIEPSITPTNGPGKQQPSPFGARLASSPYHFPYAAFTQLGPTNFSACCGSQGNTPMNYLIPTKSPINCLLPITGYVDFSQAMNELPHTPQLRNRLMSSPRLSGDIPKAGFHSGIMSAFSPIISFKDI